MWRLCRRTTTQGRSILRYKADTFGNPRAGGACTTASGHSQGYNEVQVTVSLQNQ